MGQAGETSIRQPPQQKRQHTYIVTKPFDRRAANPSFFPLGVCPPSPADRVKRSDALPLKVLERSSVVEGRSRGRPPGLSGVSSPKALLLSSRSTFARARLLKSLVVKAAEIPVLECNASSKEALRLLMTSDNCRSKGSPTLPPP